MNVTIQAIKFDASEKLNEFIEKKVAKISKFYEGISDVEVILKVTKPEAANNKEASIKIIAPRLEIFAEKTCDSFEQSVDECLEALQKQLIKAKEKK